MTSETRDLRKNGNYRYILTGHLTTETGLHVGSGYGSPRTDATVVRDAWDRPYIPGSSFKGALRSAVERLVAGWKAGGVTSCQLSSDRPICLTTNPAWQEAYSRLIEGGPDEGKLVTFLEGNQGLCDTCRLFGSPQRQSRLLVSDLPLIADGDDKPQGEIRHGVGIDRDTLTARERIKYDFEALPSQLRFRIQLTLERPSPLDVGLLALGLQEMVLGFVPLGGIRTRGLGRCKLELDSVRRVNLADKAALLAFLTAAPGQGGEAIPPTDFIRDGLKALSRALGEEAADVPPTRE
jgi:CRISPR-associated RAMP protein (TIGR02581 family)